ncbi:hypothetical protein EDB81DRAFT_863026 [Dactylonectria macrodidyma]|uniref:Uncharacterized protein n=1 Tax=Dactylonectria macrodidyma TaxID=307937 RepID=A0A9P9D1C4_9HYPO|nr:hypothetical protein EDB81DRAFT_863026 [Dactylonectria macrodidyma]
MAVASTCPLLSLPHELRNQVYLTFLFSSDPCPANPDACRSTHYGIPNPPNGNLSYKAVGYVPANTNSRRLLAVSSQVRSEVSALVASLRSQDKLDYHLDLIVENVGRLFATPRCFPAPAGHIPILRADLRFFGQYDLSQGCVALWGQSLTSFLNMFLSLGPDYVRLSSRQRPRERVSIKTLAINILSVPMTPEWMVRVRVVLQPGEEAKDVGDLELGLRVVEREIENLLDCRPRLLRDNYLLYEGIEVVESWAGGRLRRKWVMNAMSSQS